MLDFTHEQLPGRIVFGPGRRHDLAAEINTFAPSRVLLIGGRHDTATIDETSAALTAPVETIIGVRPHVPAETVAAALAVVDRFRPDVVVTVGGGSATGLGKMIARDRDITLLAVPTTYAGSEMTPIWGTTDGGVKTTGRSPRVLPATVIYDPELTVGLPKAVTVNSAFNAMAHCVEALWLPTTSPIGAEAAVGAITSIVAGVNEVVADLSRVEARAQLLYGAHRAGSVLATAGTGLLHQSAHVLGGLFDLDHGALYAVLTPPMVEHHLSTTPAAKAALTAGLGPDPAGALRELAAQLDAPRSLAEIGVPPSRVGDAVEAIARHTGGDSATIDAVLASVTTG